MHVGVHALCLIWQPDDGGGALHACRLDGSTLRKGCNRCLGAGGWWMSGPKQTQQLQQAELEVQEALKGGPEQAEGDRPLLAQAEGNGLQQALEHQRRH
ncbi:hypothetical protein ABBQ32_011677 [Trebouxia sp. C0010 RCD-2024]